MSILAPPQRGRSEPEQAVAVHRRAPVPGTFALQVALSAASLPLQRKCTCGGTGGACPECVARRRRERTSASVAPGAIVSPDEKEEAAVATKLELGPVDEPFEREADDIADRVMRSVQPGGVAEGNGQLRPGSETALRTTSAASKTAPTKAPAEVAAVLREPGEALDAGTAAQMGSHFGADFSRVRVHTGAAAAKSAAAIRARAYTGGEHVVFGAGEFAPATAAGKRLLAHELTHVLQHRGSPLHTVRRAGEEEEVGGEVGGELSMKERCLADLFAITNKPGPAAVYAKGGCPPNFCQPFADRSEAERDLQKARNCILAGILVKLSEGSTLVGGPGEKVLKFWDLYLGGGSPPIDISATHAQFFSESSTTEWLTHYFMVELRKDMEANHAAGRQLSEYSHMPNVSAAQQAIGTPGHVREMDFDVPGEVAGNLAGGVGKEQLDKPIGALPSPWEDLRAASVTVHLTPNTDGSVTVTPEIAFVVQDTIDLCPGNCGQSEEQVATIPLSRFEATGLTGDVPFIVRFQPPAELVPPFVVGGR